MLTEVKGAQVLRRLARLIQLRWKAPLLPLTRRSHGAMAALNAHLTFNNLLVPSLNRRRSFLLAGFKKLNLFADHETLVF
jgi:hypothetical protein